MVIIKYGPNEIKGELAGFSPGSSEFEIELVGDVKILFSSKNDRQYQTFNAIRVAMNNVGLNKLRSSTIDFNTGRITLDKEETTPIPKKESLGRSTGSGMIG